MFRAATLPGQIPDLPALPIVEDLSDRVTKAAAVAPQRAKELAAEGQKRAQDLAAKAPLVPRRRRSRLSLAWPVLAVMAGIGLFMVVRSRRTRALDPGQSAPSGAYARN